MILDHTSTQLCESSRKPERLAEAAKAVIDWVQPDFIDRRSVSRRASIAFLASSEPKDVIEKYLR